MSNLNIKFRVQRNIFFCKPIKKLGAALLGRLGVLFKRGNAAILGNRVPTLPDANIDGVL